MRQERASQARAESRAMRSALPCTVVRYGSSTYVRSTVVHRRSEIAVIKTQYYVACVALLVAAVAPRATLAQQSGARTFVPLGAARVTCSEAGVTADYRARGVQRITNAQVVGVRRLVSVTLGAARRPLMVDEFGTIRARLSLDPSFVIPSIGVDAESDRERARALALEVLARCAQTSRESPPPPRELSIVGKAATADSAITDPLAPLPPGPRNCRGPQADSSYGVNVAARRVIFTATSPIRVVRVIVDGSGRLLSFQSSVVWGDPGSERYRRVRIERGRKGPLNGASIETRIDASSRPNTAPLGAAETVRAEALAREVLKACSS